MYNFDEMITRIKTIKKEKKLSNEALANLAGVPKGTLSKILGSETKDPQISTIIKIAEALEVSADYIIFGKIDNKIHGEFIDLFSSLNSTGKNKVIEYMSDLHKSGIYSITNGFEGISNDLINNLENAKNIPTQKLTNTK